LIWNKVAAPVAVNMLRKGEGADDAPVRQRIYCPADGNAASAGRRHPPPCHKECFSVSYTINRMFNDDTFDNIDVRTRKALADKGFGILTEIDVKATMKKKLDVDMPSYRILGACNPKMAHQAIGLEPRVGAMLPCNVIVREVDGGIEVSAIDPAASMQAIDNQDLHAVAGQVRDLLAQAVAAI
jgi:uncharacterized protein (DUF302 family)